MKPISFPEKDPEEVVTLTFDFTKDLGAETINGAPVIALTVVSGTDPASAAVLNGAAQLDGTSKMVVQSVKAGVANVDYRVKVKVPTTGGRVLTLARILPVRDA